jgi:hypothetical protein
MNNPVYNWNVFGYHCAGMDSKLWPTVRGTWPTILLFIQTVTVIIVFRVDRDGELLWS